jgi:hypothetical protein
VNHVRLGCAVAGFVLALVSVALDSHRVGWGAIALLAASLILRLLELKRQNGGSGSESL